MDKIPMLETRIAFVLSGAVLWLCFAAAEAQQLSGQALIEELEDGGFVIAIRHARSPRDRPGPREAAPGNVDGERQLDDYGRATLSAMGYAFREFGIPVGDVLTSPAYRAVESGEYFGFGERRKADELGPQSGDADWLRAKAADAPRQGRNTVLITHAGNLTAAFGEDAANMDDGEALIFRPVDGRAELVARMPIEEWPKLAVRALSADGS